MSDLFSKHGIDHIMSVIEENVEWFFGDPDLQEIGSSDVSCCCAAVLKDLGYAADEVEQIEYRLIRNGVSNVIHDVREKYNDPEFA